MSTNPPYATVVGERNYRADFYIMEEKIDNIYKFFQSLSIVNIAGMGATLLKLDAELNKLTDFNVHAAELSKNIKNLDKNLNRFNSLIKPISDLAEQRTEALRIESNIKLAELKAKSTGSNNVWREYQTIVNGEQKYLTVLLCLGSAFIGYNLQHTLRPRL